MNISRMWTIVRLELTQRTRSVAWYVLMGIFAVLLLIVTVMSFSVFSSSTEQGGGVYSVVVFFVLLLVVLVSPTLSGNVINGDRDAATLAPLQITLASTGDIVLGKFVAAWITGLAFLAVAVPFLLAAMLGGGVGPATLIVSLLVLILETGVVAAIGVGLSGVLAKPLFSVASTYLVVAALVIGTLIAFMLGGGAVRDQGVSYTRDYVYDRDTGQIVEPQVCGEWEEYSFDVPRFDYFWGFLAANPFVILADATPSAFDVNGNPQDMFGWIKAGVRGAQVTPELEQRWDGCDSTSWQDDSLSVEDVEQATVPSWWVGVAIQLIIAGGLMWWGWARTRTPARRLPPGTRIA